MRVLIASTRGAGHFNPMVPFADACLRHGHDLLACGPPSLEGAVKRRGFGFWRFDDPPEDELDEVWGRVRSLTPEEQNELVVGKIFGRLDATASLPHLREACDEWRPDVVLRESAEFGSALAAELGGIPHARVGICLASFQELSAVGVGADGRASPLGRAPRRSGRRDAAPLAPPDHFPGIDRGSGRPTAAAHRALPRSVVGRADRGAPRLVDGRRSAARLRDLRERRRWYGDGCCGLLGSRSRPSPNSM